MSIQPTEKPPEENLVQSDNRNVDKNKDITEINQKIVDLSHIIQKGNKIDRSEVVNVRDRVSELGDNTSKIMINELAAVEEAAGIVPNQRVNLAPVEKLVNAVLKDNNTFVNTKPENKESLTGEDKEFLVKVEKDGVVNKDMNLRIKLSRKMALTAKFKMLKQGLEKISKLPAAIIIRGPVKKLDAVLKEKWAIKDNKPDCTKEVFDYTVNLVEDKKQHWFANFSNLRMLDRPFSKDDGGQEGRGSIMFPELYATGVSSLDEGGFSTVLTRIGGKKVGQGDPYPLLHMGAKYVGDIKQNKPPEKKHPDLADYTLDVCEEPIPTNIFSMAAPDNTGKKEDSVTISYAEDIYHTVYTAFSQVKDHSDKSKGCIIHSGKFGCGFFGNDDTLVYLVQRLAANQVGNVELKLHMYDKNEAESANILWETINTKITNSNDRSIKNCLKIIVEERRDLRTKEANL